MPATRPAGGTGGGGDGAVSSGGWPDAPEATSSSTTSITSGAGGGGGGGAKISYIASTPYDRGADNSGADGRGGGNGGSGVVLVRELNRLKAPGVWNINEVYEKVKEGLDWFLIYNHIINSNKQLKGK